MSSTTNSKSLAMMFLLGAFLAGGALGIAGDRTFFSSHRRGRPFTEKSMRDELAIKLKLNPQQRASMDSAYDWRKARIDEIMQPITPQLDAVRDSTAALIVARLDSAQAAYYNAIRDSSRARFDSARRGQGGRR